LNHSTAIALLLEPLTVERNTLPLLRTLRPTDRKQWVRVSFHQKRIDI